MRGSPANCNCAAVLLTVTVYRAWLCDQDFDCDDKSDEEGCECGEGKLLCGDSLCLPVSWFCDGIEDCSNGTDEDAVFCASRECVGDKFR